MTVKAANCQRSEVFTLLLFLHPPTGQEVGGSHGQEDDPDKK
jgi:hypothetical protein